MTIFRKVIGWSLLLLLIMCIIVFLQSTSVLLVDGGLTPALLAELRRVCGADWVFTQEHQLRTYESDGLLQYHALPAAAVLPGSAEQVQAVVRACAREACRGSPAAPAPGCPAARCRSTDGVLIVVSRLNRILEIDRDNAAHLRRAGRHEPRPCRPRSRPTSSIRPTRRARSSARSAATSPRTPAARTASSTASRRTTSAASRSCCPTARWSCSAARSSTRPATTCSARSSARRARSASRRRSWLRVVPVPETVKTLVAFFDSTARRRRGGRRDRHARASSRARSR